MEEENTVEDIDTQPPALAPLPKEMRMQGQSLKGKIGDLLEVPIPDSEDPS